MKMIWSLQLFFTLHHSDHKKVFTLSLLKPKIQMVWLLSAEVRQKLIELDQAELEVSFTEDLLLPVVLSSRSSALVKLLLT